MKVGIKINFDEWARELDELRPTTVSNSLTLEQCKALVVARSGPRPVTWEKLATWWERHFNQKISASTISRYYKRAVVKLEKENAKPTR